MAVSLLRALALAALLFPPTDAAVRVLISGLPLMGHINPLASKSTQSPEVKFTLISRVLAH